MQLATLNDDGQLQREHIRFANTLVTFAAACYMYVRWHQEGRIAPVRTNVNITTANPVRSGITFD